MLIASVGSTSCDVRCKVLGRKCPVDANSASVITVFEFQLSRLWNNSSANQEELCAGPLLISGAKIFRALDLQDHGAHSVGDLDDIHQQSFILHSMGSTDIFLAARARFLLLIATSVWFYCYCRRKLCR